jgi:hypothetical protein
MRKCVMIAIAVVLTYLATTLTVLAQLGPEHFKSWDNRDRTGVRQKVRTTRTTTRRATTRQRVARAPVRHAAPRKATRVASAPPARKEAVEAGEATVKSPFGVVMKLVGSLRGVPSSIQSFLSAVSSQCGGVKVISGYRPGARVAGTRVTSCHAMGQAADYTTSNPACALRVATGYGLGHSIDYGRVGHYHVSSCSREAGMRFNHGGGGRYARRSAIRHAKARGTKIKRVRYAHYKRR